jgi:hypothetical protein
VNYERKEFSNHLRQQRVAKVRESKTQLRQVAQAELAIDVVTKSPEWDYFLSLLQSEVDQLDQMLEVLQQAYAREPSFSYEAMAERKAQLMQVSVQRDTLMHVLSLPKEIMEKGAKAKLALQDYSDQ